MKLRYGLLLEKYVCCQDLEVCTKLVILGENESMFSYAKALWLGETWIKLLARLLYSFRKKAFHCFVIFLLLLFFLFCNRETCSDFATVFTVKGGKNIPIRFFFFYNNKVIVINKFCSEVVFQSAELLE